MTDAMTSSSPSLIGESSWQCSDFIVIAFLVGIVHEVSIVEFGITSVVREVLVLRFH